MHNRVWENICFCNVLILSKKTKVLEFNQYQKSDKAYHLLFMEILNV